MSDKSQNAPKIIAEKSDDFKLFFADGVYTWLGTDSGTLSFFMDEMDPVIDDNGVLHAKSIKRKFVVEIRMSPSLYDSIIKWMIERKQILESTIEKSESSK